jgi:hypothetical protein
MDLEKTPVGLILAQAGFRVGWDHELGGFAATKDFFDGGRKRKLVVGRPESEGLPDQPEDPVLLALYDVEEDGSLEVVCQAVFESLSALFDAVVRRPWVPAGAALS